MFLKSRKYFSVSFETFAVQSLDFYIRLPGRPVSDHVLINRASKERALHQVIKYSPGAI